MKLSCSEQTRGGPYNRSFRAMMEADGLGTMLDECSAELNDVLWLHEDPVRLMTLQKLIGRMTPGALSRFNSPRTARDKVQAVLTAQETRKTHAKGRFKVRLVSKNKAIVGYDKANDCSFSTAEQGQWITDLPEESESKNFYEVYEVGREESYGFKWSGGTGFSGADYRVWHRAGHRHEAKCSEWQKAINWIDRNTSTFEGYDYFQISERVHGHDWNWTKKCWVPEGTRTTYGLWSTKTNDWVGEMECNRPQDVKEWMESKAGKAEIASLSLEGTVEVKVQPHRGRRGEQ